MFEPIEYLRSIPYREYLNTRWWKSVKADHEREYLAKIKICACCQQERIIGDRLTGRWIAGLPKFHLHHVTYANIGNEQPGDLALVCAACHNLIHYPLSRAAKYWVTVNPSGLASNAEKLRPEEPEDNGEVSQPFWE